MPLKYAKSSSSRWTTPGPARWCRHAVLAVLLTVLTLFTLVHLLRTQADYCSAPVDTRLAARPSSSSSSSSSSASGARPYAGPSHALVDFWHELVAELAVAKPATTSITHMNPDMWVFNPEDPDHERNLDSLYVADDEMASLTAQHARFVDSIQARLASRLPYARGTRGIVMTVSPDYLGIAMTSLLMLRRSGSTLPVQLFLDGAGERGRARCADLLAHLDVSCLNLDDYLALEPNSPAEAALRAHGSDEDHRNLTKYQFKVFALLFSSFQQFLFLDADAFPVHNPDGLLAVEPFASHGLVTWPDYWVPTVAPQFYAVAGVAAPNLTDESRASESGVLLCDKARHAETLLLAAYYNFYGPDRYYTLLSQGAWGQGDKETFLQAAYVLGRPAWAVQTPARLLTSPELNYGSGIRQADPAQDVRAARERQQAREAEAEFDARVAAAAARARDGQWQEEPDAADVTREEDVAPSRWMFAHLNRVKIDARRMISSVVGDTILRGTEEGVFTRLWGDDSEPLIEAAGYDVERTLWDELLKVNCQWTLLEECETVRIWYDEVFGPEPQSLR